MFLNKLQERNPNLLNAAIEFHQKGLLFPDTYLLDVDTILDNARLLIEEAKKNNIKLYAMTKQIGRIPFLAKKILELGYSGVVAVDFKEAEIMIENNIPLGNVGHLVQTPTRLLEKIIKSNVEIMTVYSYEKIEQIDKVAKKLNKIQNIMLRVLEEDSTIYSGQSGGFYLNELEGLCMKIKKLKNIKINGLTSFPCYLYDKSINKVKSTKNVETIKKAQEPLTKEFILKTTAEFYYLTISQIISKNRTRNLVTPREICMYLMRELLDITFSEIGTTFSNRDHSTVMKACKRVETKIKKDPDYKLAVDKLKQKLGTM